MLTCPLVSGAMAWISGVMADIQGVSESTAISRELNIERNQIGAMSALDHLSALIGFTDGDVWHDTHPTSVIVVTSYTSSPSSLALLTVYVKV